MYNKTITLFNYYESNDEYFYTVIYNVEIQPIYKTIPNTSETSNQSSCLIIIPYNSDDLGNYVNLYENKKYYLKPKKWGGNPEYFTIQNNVDFIIEGIHTDIPDINLNEIKNTMDDVFVINQIKDFSDDLKHFELTVN